MSRFSFIFKRHLFEYNIRNFYKIRKYFNLYGIFKDTNSEDETIVVFMSDNGGNTFTNIEPNKPLR